MALTIEQLKEKYSNSTTNTQVENQGWSQDERSKFVAELRLKDVAKKQQKEKSEEGTFSKIGGFFKDVGLAVTSSERALGKTIGGALATGSKEVKEAQESQVKLDEMSQKLVDKIKEVESSGGDSSKLRQRLQDNMGQNFDISTVIPETQKTGKQIAGEVLGVGLDIATAGTLAKGATTFKMFGTAQKANLAKEASKGLSIAQAVAKNIEGSYKATTGAKLLDIAGKTTKNIAKGATLGYGYDISEGLKAGANIEEAAKPGVGTMIGAAIPFGLGIKSATNIITKAQAPRVINSLIKPLLKDFSYGKNPGRTVAIEGIIANDLDEFGSKIATRRQEIGQQIGELNRNLQGKAQLSVEDAFNPIKTAMEEAAKNNNETLLKRLQAVNEALSDNLVLGKDELGNPSIISQGKKNLNTMGFDEAFNLKKDIGELTQWTGNASDDKAVNAALKQTYGAVKEVINDTAKKVDPETAEKLIKLNEKYADLTSAEIATKYRDKIVGRQNIISLSGKLGTIAGLTTAIMTGQAPVTTILAGISGALLDKALGSTAVKTRFAKMLAGESASAIEKILNKNPKIRQAIYDAFDADISEETKSLLQRINKWIGKKTGLSVDDVTREAMDLQRDTLTNTISKNKNKLIEAVSKGKLTTEEWSKIDDIQDLIEKGKDTPNSLRDTIELLKKADIDIADEMNLPRDFSSPTVGKTVSKTEPITAYHIPREKGALEKIKKEGFSLDKFGSQSGTKDVGDPKGVYFFPSKSSSNEWKTMMQDEGEYFGTIKSNLNIEKPLTIKTQKDVDSYFKMVKEATGTKAKDLESFRDIAGKNDSEKISKYLQSKGYDAIIDKDGLLSFNEPQIIMLDLNKIQK